VPYGGALKEIFAVLLSIWKRKHHGDEDEAAAWQAFAEICREDPDIADEILASGHPIRASRTCSSRSGSGSASTHGRICRTKSGRVASVTAEDCQLRLALLAADERPAREAERRWLRVRAEAQA